MSAIGGRHTSNRHVGVANRLELLEPMAGHNVIEGREVLVKKIDQRRGLRSFGQKCEVFEIREQNGRRAVSAAPELVGDRRRQDVVEKIFMRLLSAASSLVLC